MEENKVSFSFEARYYKIGNLDASTRQVWFALHGYGQLAQYFIKKFQSLTDKGICIIAPEGLSRFYLAELTEQGRQNNKVGATWMTSENRLTDIQNYITFLDAVHERELAAFPHVSTTILGFSQGSATACRWITQGKIKFDRLILWAGIFPPDMDFTKGHHLLSSKKTYLVIGKNDQFLDEVRMKEFDQLAVQLGIQPEKIIFDGKHEINEQVLASLAL